MLKKLSKTENEFHQNQEETKPNYDSQSNYYATGLSTSILWKQSWNSLLS